MVALLHHFVPASASRLRHELFFGSKSLIQRQRRVPRRYLSSNRKIQQESEIVDKRVERPRRRRRTASFLTDVEGDQQYLTRFVEQSRILQFASCNSTVERRPSLQFPFPYDHHIEFQNTEDSNEPILVYGGDVWDQGGSDLYVIRQLLSLKARYPNQVYFIFGNRDINKIRISQELGLTEDKENGSPPHGGVYWLRGTGRVGDPLLLKDELNDATTSSLTRDPVDRLKWMLKKTMGSPRAFQYRKEELQRERDASKGTHRATVCDDDVVASYRESCHPNGEMGLYLSEADLALRMGPILFLHGALPLTSSFLQETLQQRGASSTSSVWDDFTKFMPWLPLGTTAHDVGVASCEEWIEHLNQFAKRSIDAWRNENGHNSNKHREHPQVPWCLEGGYHNESSSCECGAFLQYGMGWTANRKQNPTVVYNRWSSNGMPFRFIPSSLQTFTTEGDGNDEENELYTRSVKEFFQQSPQLSLICSGHQPQGDIANAICLGIDNKNDNRSKRLGWIIPADTSYSGDVSFWNREKQTAQNQVGREQSKSGRGMRAICEVLISWDEDEPLSDTNPHVRFHGTLSDGTTYETRSLPMTTPSNSQYNIGNIDEAGIGPTPEESPHEGPWWCRASFRDGSLLLSGGHGFNFWNCLLKNPREPRS